MRQLRKHLTITWVAAALAFASALPLVPTHAAWTQSETPRPATAWRRINFRPGATVDWEHGRVRANAQDQYVLNALGGQEMTINLVSPGDGAYLSIWGADGTVLISDHAGATSWRGRLPRTQDYNIVVSSASSGFVNYTMRVSIPAPQPNPPRPSANRIRIPSGRYSATVSGVVVMSRSDLWVVNVGAGTTMSIRATTPNPVALVIYGADGTVLLSDHAGAMAWSGQAPSSQDYYIAVQPVGGDSANYNLTVTLVPPGSNPPQPTGNRINFPPGTNTASVTGVVVMSRSERWVVTAYAGQTMIVRATTPNPVALVIYGADGTVLISDHAGAMSWSGPVPSTQDYTIEVLPVGGDSANYTLTVTLQ